MGGGPRSPTRSGKRVFLIAVIASLSTAALLAIGILLFGDFGQTEGRVLWTTALVAAYGLLALPAGILFDQGRLRPLAGLVLTLAAGGLLLALVGVWGGEAPEALGRGLGTVTVCALAATQTAALAARASRRDSMVVRRLFRASVALVIVLAGMVSAAIWAEVDDERYLRIVAALVVLDVLLCTLQPILALMRPAGVPHRLRLRGEAGEEVEATVEAADFAAAAAKAIRAAERDGHRVRGLERVEPSLSARRPGRNAAR
jgi:Kef-type K+ transport system membrane component KefB